MTEENMNKQNEATEAQTELSDADIEKRKQDILNFLKKYKTYLPYLALTIILWIAYKIRISNLPGLKDATTGGYIPGDPDAMLFLRYVRYLLEHGTLQFWDTMRYVPYGYDPTTERTLLAYFSVYFYKIIHLFSATFTIEQAHVMYPAVAFVIGAIFFYLLTKKLFDYKIALLATAALSFMPIYLFRTMSGISDKEALGFLFYYLAMYLFVLSWDRKELKFKLPLCLLSGIATALMAWAWGGVNFLFLTIGGFVIIELLMNKFSADDFYSYTAWIIPIIIMLPVMHPDLLNFQTLVTSLTSGIMTIAFGVALVNFIFFEKNLFGLKHKIEKHLAPGFASVLISIVLGMIFLTILYGPYTIPHKIEATYNQMLSPYAGDRWQLTVAENNQPYITEWIGQMGWLYLILFYIGGIYLFYELLSPIKEGLAKSGLPYVNRTSATIFYSLFLFLFTFSRYSRDAVYFNGTSTEAKLAYVGSLVLFILSTLGLILYAYYYNRKLYDEIKTLDKKYIFLTVWFIIMIVGARGAIRLLMMLAPISAILTSYLIVSTTEYSLKIKDNLYKYLALFVIVIILFSPYALGSKLGQGYMTRYYTETTNSAKYIRLNYDQQWQYGGKWVKENTPEDAVFVHWWDYGYLVQTGWNRATVTDGGNAHGYWNYQVGRHVLTAQNETEALEVLYAHNVSYMVIVADEIGKYTAYSSIGSDVNYDRYSWITTFTMDPKQTQEKRDETVLLYTGGYMLDDDFFYEGQMYPRQAAGIGGVFLPIVEETIGTGNETRTIQKFKQPTAALFFNGQRKDVPIECLYMDNVKTTFDKPGLKGCFRMIPQIVNNQMSPIGAGMYISEEGTKALWAQLYLMNKASDAFQLVYDDSASGQPIQVPLALYNGRNIGPLRIWKINYPDGFTISEEKLDLYHGFVHEDIASTRI